MTILFVSDQYLPQVNGIVHHLITLKQELEKRGHKVIIVSHKNINQPKAQKIKDVLYLPAIPFPLRPKDSLTLPFFRRVEKKLLKEQIDIVHSHLFLTGFFALSIAQKKKVPKIVTVHTLFRHYVDWVLPWENTLTGQITNPIVDWITRNYFNKYDAIIAPSSKALDDLQKAEVKAPIKLIHNGINLDVFQSAKKGEFIKRFNIDRKRPLVVTVGRIDRGKNIDLAIKSIKKVKEKIPNIQLAIVGDGMQRKTIELMIKKMRLSNNVIITGFVDQRLVASANKAADVFLFTSDTDTLPTVVIEAAASGKPIVSVYDKAIIEIIKPEKNGILVTRDHKAIADALITILQNNNLSKRYGRESFNISKEFSIKTCADKLENLYKEVIAVKSTRKW